MAVKLGLADQILTVPKTDLSAYNRFILDPTASTPTLARMPSSMTSALSSVFTSKLLREAFVPAAFRSLLPARRPRSQQSNEDGDESVDAFFSRHFGKNIARNMISAMVRGIYGADSRELSVGACFPAVAALGGGNTSILLKGLTAPKTAAAEADTKAMDGIKEALRAEGLEELVARLENASVWGLKGGLGTLSLALRRRLEEKHNVEFILGAKEGAIASTRYDAAGSEWEVMTASGKAFRCTHLAVQSPSVLPPPFQPSPTIPQTSISVVSLAFDLSSDAFQFPRGFGYLIPRTVPVTQNPHNALGVIFDSQIMPLSDSAASRGLSKVSLLSGGPYYSADPALLSPPPTPEQLVERALATLELHFPAFSSARTPPLALSAATHINCIPSPPVGHPARMRALREQLATLPGGTQLAVVGGGLNKAGVGVNGAVRAAWDVMQGWEKGETATGLEGW